MKNLVSLMILVSVIVLPQITEAQTISNQQDTLKAALMRAQSLAKQGNTEEASKIYTDLMGNFPDNRDAVQGWLMINMKRTATGEEEAIKQLEELAKSYPKNTGILFFKAFLNAEYNHSEEAMKDIEKLIRIQPDTALNYILRGQVLSRMKEYQGAFEAFDRATSLDPKRFDVWNMKAVSLSKLGKLDDALTAIDKAVEMAPKHPVNFYNRACIYSLKGDKANALADLEKAISMSVSFKKSAINDEDFKSLYDDEEFKKLTAILTIGQKAPDFTLNDVDGNPVTLSSRIGPKLLLIDFWAGWCSPCRVENPNVVKIYNEFKDKGFDILGVSLDRFKDSWIKAIEDDQLPWMQVSDLNYFNSAVAKLYDVTAIPANFLLNEKGIIIAMNLRGETLYNRVKSILSSETVTDIDGNVYNTVTIGTQVWMTENLKTSKYSNGDPIPNVIDTTEWIKLKTGAYCNIHNKEEMKNTYGCLYNWYAVNDKRNIAPEGWHVPTEAEWKTLIEYLGGEGVAGGKVKESGTDHWLSPNVNATNQTGLTLLPGGNRNPQGLFNIIGRIGFWWSSTEYSKENAWRFEAMAIHGRLIGKNSEKLQGFAVRCVKDQIIH